ncbi:HEPN domain-containing protein [Dyadobacter psychrotolerans]|uniref:Uncharacterized protein n=1 Tax=Dyadobacter psychrotolerans TaxID=2541721 RepID=A0A4R5DTD5_9BACT|nr:HEPN domain-containing protein [Dyadobacter psychrotolerans]TDE15550.1 hypothetical protein E0F88_13685 [Dyadobacter psychrotolerans]
MSYIQAISGILNLKLSEAVNFKGDIKLSPNGRNEYSDIYHNEAFLRCYGETGYTFLRDLPNMYYALPEEMAKSTSTIADSCIIAFKEFLMPLWFIKDNAVCIDRIFASDDSFVRFSMAQSNINFTNSSGDHKPEKFSKEEFDKAFSLLDLLMPAMAESKSPADLANGLTVSKKENYDDYEAQISTFNFSNYDIPRIHRAYNFLLLLRNISYLPIKIILYLSLLEALVTDFEEKGLKPKVNDRVRKYLASSEEDNSLLSSQLDAAYNFRNKFAHGQLPVLADDDGKDVPYSFDDMKVISISVDDVARRLFTKILTSNLQEFKELDKIKPFFENL